MPYRSNDGRTIFPLHNVDDGKVAIELLEKGYEANVIDDYLNTPLHTAQSAEVAAVLIASGADVNAKNEFGMKPINYARDGMIAYVLLGNGADVVAPTGIIGDDVLHGIEIAGVASALLVFGADVNMRNEFGATPLFYAQSLEICRIFVEHGAIVDARTEYNSTPIMRMCSVLKFWSEEKKLEAMRMVEYLAMCGGSLDETDEEGKRIEDMVGANDEALIVRVRQRVAMKQMSAAVEGRRYRTGFVKHADCIVLRMMNACAEVRDSIIEYV